MPGKGNPLFVFRWPEESATAFRDVACVCGYDQPGDLIREILTAVTDRDPGQVFRVMRRIDKGCGVQLDLQLMQRPGGPVLGKKRLQRALDEKKRRRVTREPT